MTDFWLIRHGQTDWNLAGRWQGQARNAPGLNDTGRLQVLALYEHIQGKKFSAIYSSDLLRARQTAELLAQSLGVPIILEPRLREMDLGVWEGMPSDEIKANYPKELDARMRNPFYAQAPMGESPHEVSKRVIAAITDIALKHTSDSVILVSHGIALAIVLCHTRGLPWESVYQHIPENAFPYHIRWTP